MGLTVLICDIAADLKPALCLHFQYLSFSSADFLYRLFIKKKKKSKLPLNCWHLQTYHFKKGAQKVISRPRFEFGAQNKFNFSTLMRSSQMASPICNICPANWLESMRLVPSAD